MSLDVRLPPPSESTRSGGGTRAREATATSGRAREAIAMTRSSEKGGTANASASVALRAIPRSATARSATVRSTTAASTRASTKPTSTAKPIVRQPLSAVPCGDASSAPEKLSAVMHEKYCQCCRGPHKRNTKPHPKLSVTQRAKEKVGSPSEFAKFYASSKLPAEKNSGSFGGAEQIRWRQQGWPHENFDVDKWLPVFVEGSRVTQEPQRMIAIEGSAQIIKAYSKHTILPLIPTLVPPLRAALNTANPPAVAAALEIVSLLLTEFDQAVDVLLECDGFRRLLPTPNTLSKCSVKVRVGYRTKKVGGETKRLDVIIHESLSLMAEKGGPRGLKIIKSYVPTFDPSKPEIGKNDDKWGPRRGGGR